MIFHVIQGLKDERLEDAKYLGDAFIARSSNARVSNSKYWRGGLINARVSTIVGEGLKFHENPNQVGTNQGNKFRKYKKNFYRVTYFNWSNKGHFTSNCRAKKVSPFSFSMFLCQGYWL